ncbi:unnamed protein product [Mytilus coruscus]|uniref:Uncharacterized protein n=1 Tax=Mytilus coruscus TaxID=42192 RepID=A0A6J8ALV4_MYTCO|nr:unnamed protein product [Mytilus coruscus]
MLNFLIDTAPTPPFSVLGYYGSSPSVNVSVINHTVTWLEASQSCFSYQFLELFADSSVDKLLDHLLDVNQMLQHLLWPADSHLWIGYLNNGSTYLMVDGDKCVASADLFPVLSTTGGTGCILLNVTATTSLYLLYTEPCDEKHEYLCEAPNHVETSSSRYENMKIDLSLILDHVIIHLLKPDENQCKQEMRNRKMAFAVVFYKTHLFCHVYEKLVFEFPVNVKIDTTNEAVVTIVKTTGTTVTIRQKNAMQASHANLIQNCFPSDALPTMKTEKLTTIQAEPETAKTTEENTKETTMMLTEKIPLQTTAESAIEIIEEIPTISTTKELTTQKLEETGIKTTQLITSTKETTTDHKAGVFCSPICCSSSSKLLNNSFIGDVVLDDLK